MYLTPVEYVIRIFGGVRATARALGYYPSAVSRWRKRKDYTIPSSSHKKVLETAKRKKLDLTAHDLIYGKFVEEK